MRIAPHSDMPAARETLRALRAQDHRAIAAGILALDKIGPRITNMVAPQIEKHG